MLALFADKIREKLANEGPKLLKSGNASTSRYIFHVRF